MLGKLIDMLPDSVKGVTTTFIPSQPTPRVQIISASFEYIPISALLPDIDTQSAFLTNHLCLIVCTTHAFEIWGMSSYRKFQQIYFRPENGLRNAHYIPLRPFDPTTISITENIRGHLNANLPVIAISKQTEEYSSALGIHLYSLKNSKYFHVFRFTSELIDFLVSEHVIVAVLKGGQIRIFNLLSLEQHSAIDTIFLSKEMHDLAINEDANADLHMSVAAMIKDLSTMVPITTTVDNSD